MVEFTELFKERVNSLTGALKPMQALATNDFTGSHKALQTQKDSDHQKLPTLPHIKPVTIHTGISDIIKTYH